MKQTQWLKSIPSDVGHYLVGFADGEGSFNVSLRRREDHTMKWQVVLTFNISQRDRTVLAIFKRYLGCGRMQTRKDGVLYYVVSNPLSISEKVIPFFEKFNFLSATKKRNFAIFKKIAKLVEEQQHLNHEGLKKIIELREELNHGRGRKRKYSIIDYQKSLQENPQRLYAKPRKFRQEISRKI
ncbi:MAG: hypothetical protein A3F54_01545 [Candidatus Kerfeldbacteria bacterium RIFCSPHIGHO2_12_FULL_48_17]|uniref:Homing endonuclease LAGLIDADG domain-containing protein n=1 Tax=Candidatus Kerfeldbacteria bacterium RIFCSPHIGHO2_12_FULL_48_17 TaxID=1798542 RepID=A0A1G2BA07_9BACT|nr:MAG: hypothetical protein A3F54_01545 [Candidatus Kerfeldbacteria bacterium RIFCSPHIGHO2_12_FULL_48_17]